MLISQTTLGNIRSKIPTNWESGSDNITLKITPIVHLIFKKITFTGQSGQMFGNLR